VNILRFLREQAKNYDCSVCGTNHGKSEISLLGKRQGAWVVRVACSTCDTAITLLVYAGTEKESAVVPLPDGAKRVRRAALSRNDGPPLTGDDVLDAHDVLGSYTGDALALFAPSEKVRSSSTAS
jgi:hypothetical protein